jgi:hypothetical protein
VLSPAPPSLNEVTGFWGSPESTNSPGPCQHLFRFLGKKLPFHPVTPHHLNRAPSHLQSCLLVPGFHRA